MYDMAPRKEKESELVRPFSPILSIHFRIKRMGENWTQLIISAVAPIRNAITQIHTVQNQSNPLIGIPLSLCLINESLTNQIEPALML